VLLRTCSFEPLRRVRLMYGTAGSGDDRQRNGAGAFAGPALLRSGCAVKICVGVR
jgi:hypothetical protein